MTDDEPIEIERKGASAGLNPMFGDWQHRFDFAPVSYAGGADARAKLRQAMHASMKNAFFFSDEVRLEITLYLDVQTILETDETADVDNFAKAILDGLKGPSGVLLDDTQVQALTISWLDSYGKQSNRFEVAVSASPDDFMLKPVELYEMADGLWYPQARRLWTDGEARDQTEVEHYLGLMILETMASSKKEARHLFRRGGMDRLRAYQTGLYFSSPARGFHRSRVDTNFTMHSREQWQSSLADWRLNHKDLVGGFEKMLAELADLHIRVAEAISGVPKRGGAARVQREAPPAAKDIPPTD